MGPLLVLLGLPAAVVGLRWSSERGVRLAASAVLAPMGLAAAVTGGALCFAPDFFEPRPPSQADPVRAHLP